MENKVEINLAHNDMGDTSVSIAIDKEGILTDVWINPNDILDMLEFELDNGFGELDVNQQERLIAFCKGVIELEPTWRAKNLCSTCPKNFECEEDCGPYLRVLKQGVDDID